MPRGPTTEPAAALSTIELAAVSPALIGKKASTVYYKLEMVGIPARPDAGHKPYARTYNPAMGRRLAYTLLGVGIGRLIALLLGAVLGKRVGFGTGTVGFAFGCGSIAVGIAERWGKVKSLEEVNRPVTLFSYTFRRNSK
jgi:hypothetical protein